MLTVERFGGRRRRVDERRGQGRAGRGPAAARLDQRLPPLAPGRFKQSGFGRELGPSGLAEYRETKHIWRNTDPSPQGWFA
ncbi:hypothetical protein GCM10018780_69120 [Streptomyces lanatus]|nr:hypothetical protein GCM10018780_69120 [Streptomyces lanatus]